MANPNNRVIKVNLNRNKFILLRKIFSQTIKLKSGSNKVCIVDKKSDE